MRSCVQRVPKSVAHVPSAASNSVKTCKSAYLRALAALRAASRCSTSKVSTKRLSLIRQQTSVAAQATNRVEKGASASRRPPSRKTAAQSRRTLVRRAGQVDRVEMEARRGGNMDE